MLIFETNQCSNHSVVCGTVASDSVLRSTEILLARCIVTGANVRGLLGSCLKHRGGATVSALVGELSPKDLPVINQRKLGKHLPNGLERAISRACNKTPTRTKVASI
ncbi:hypothetical protein PoB_004329400 [Plakobranchus ocellatus]|uniref:Uncharacterized protein n=1 Tax=Plakobranchus ocellatus TaxID=259542 RepID=A0AAV4B9H8_9GAST|nr:hypothetical protein PoB_004329400 [Plakobranchus ocellatus]